MRVKTAENGVDIEIYLTAKETQKYFASPKYQEIQGKVEKDVIKSEDFCWSNVGQNRK